MLYFSSLLHSPEYQPAADRLSAALDLIGINYKYINNTKDIWLRDFMPVQLRNGSFVSFRYEPGYLKNEPELQTSFRRDLSPQFPFSVTCSDINLDGGNVVFSPSKEKVIISDRIFLENPTYRPAPLVRELEELLQAQVIIIPSLKTDMTGHADGMVRFVNEHTVIGNTTFTKKGLEQRIRAVFINHGIDVADFPYYSSPKGSAEGCYLNFLETEHHIFLPVFGSDSDSEAIAAASKLFDKTIVPVNISEIAKEGGGLNCISWEAK